MQGHALFTRQAGSDLPCPLVDFMGGFNKFFGAAYNLTGDSTIQSHFGTPFGEVSIRLNPSLPGIRFRGAVRHWLIHSMPFLPAL
jgi:hypothetical protein